MCVIQENAYWKPRNYIVIDFTELLKYKRTVVASTKSSMKTNLIVCQKELYDNETKSKATRQHLHAATKSTG